jgi:hypothetical protein
MIKIILLMSALLISFIKKINKKDDRVIDYQPLTRDAKLGKK